MVKKKQRKDADTANRSELYLTKGLIFLIVLLPIIYNPWGFNLYAAIRAWLLFTGTAALLLLSFYIFLQAGRARISVHRIDLILLFFFISLLVSTAMSVHLRSSIFGHFLRYEGLLAWSAYLALFYIARQAFSKKGTEKSFVIWLARGALLISIYAILQHFGLDFLKWQQDLVTNRAFSTLGNPAYLGAYISVVLPICIAMIFGLPKHRALFSVTSLAMIAALAFSMTRGAWLSFAVSILVIMIFNIRRLRTQALLSYLGIGAILTLVVAIFIIAGPYKSQISAYTERAKEVAEVQGSVEGRLLTWKQVLPLISKYPVFGSGPDTLYLTFTGEITPEYERKVVRDTATDRAHNNFLQIAATLGLVGLFAYLLVIIEIFNLGIRRILSVGNDYSQWLMLGSLTGILSYLVMLQTHFSTIDVSPIFWVLAGLASAKSDLGSTIVEVNFKKAHISKLKSRQAAIAVFASLLLGVVIITSFLPVVADMYYKRAKVAEQNRLSMLVILNLQNALILDSGNDYYMAELGDAFLRYAPEQRNPEMLVQALDILNQARLANPLSSYHYLRLGTAHLTHYEYSREKRSLDVAKKTLARGISLDPNSAELRMKMGLAYAYSKRYKKATREWKKVIELSPKSVSAYYNLGRLLQKLGKTEESHGYFRAVLKIDPEQAQAKQALATIMPGQNLWTKYFQGLEKRFSRSTAVSVDKNGNVYVTGESHGASTKADYATVKYDSGGDQKWVQRYNGPGNGADMATGIAVDKNGNVYVTGESQGSGTKSDYATVKYDSNGDQKWVQRYNGPGNGADVATGIAVATKEMVVSGFSQGGAGTKLDYATIKYTATGKTKWVRRYNSLASDDDVATAVALFKGAVYVTGYSRGPSGAKDFSTVKYDSAGSRKWTRRHRRSKNSNGSASDICVSKDGNILVVGSSAENKKRMSSYTILKYAP